MEQFISTCQRGWGILFLGFVVAMGAACAENQGDQSAAAQATPTNPSNSRAQRAFNACLDVRNELVKLRWQEENILEKFGGSFIVNRLVFSEENEALITKLDTMDRELCTLSQSNLIAPSSLEAVRQDGLKLREILGAAALQPEDSGLKVLVLPEPDYYRASEDFPKRLKGLMEELTNSNRK